MQLVLQEKEDVSLFAQNMQERISWLVLALPSTSYKSSCFVFQMYSASGIPTSDHTFEDLLLARHARKNGLPYPAGLVEYKKNVKQLG